MNNDLNPLFHPASIAVVGASRDPRKLGSRLIRYTRQAGFSGVIYGVNPVSGVAFDGATAVTGLREIGEPTDLAILAIPRSGVLAALSDCVAVGVRTVIVPGSGFGENSQDGAEAEAEILRLASEAGIRVLGPNCFGISSASGAIDLTPFERIPGGTVGLVSQSGNVAAQLLHAAAGANIGYSHCVGIGNQLDIGFGDVLAWYAQDERTQAVAVYAEGIPAGSGQVFLDGVEACSASGKPVVVIKAGASAAGAVVAATHTRALAADDRVWTEALETAGALRVSGPDDMVDALVFAGRRRPKGRRVALITDGGGDSILALDETVSRGMHLAEYPAELQEQLDLLMPVDAPRSRGRNPLTLDTAGGVEDDPEILARCVDAISAAGVADVIVIGGLFGTYTDHRPEEIAAALSLQTVVGREEAELVFQSPLTPMESEPLRLLQEAGVPFFKSMRRLLAGLSSIMGVMQGSGGARRATNPQGILHFASDSDKGRAEADGQQMSPGSAASLLQEYGIRMPPLQVSAKLEELRDAASGMGYPVCLKIASSDVVHKSDIGGVKLGLVDVESLTMAAADLWHVVPASPLLVMPNLRSGFEVMMGARWDAQFGPVVAVGRGGIWAEIESDISLLTGEISPDRFDSALSRLRCFPILRGVRGQPPLDTASLWAVAVGLAGIVRDHPETSIDLNPVFLYRDGYAVADHRMICERHNGNARGASL
ncbi:acetate--CoA ligase family protein [Rathayibacter soli]|uniref:acetate--CoA ligase family protein n=1 Tax=Rathayibacter soli TaxID=3144168 RepID=UPI0027E57188|nr:acetate--CoA ligase family protein [Glaciibacter superstes]